TEVTQGQYKQVMGDNPSWHQSNNKKLQQLQDVNTDQFPVENILWEEAMLFCEKLSALPEEKRARRKYRLPTEAEWEYACRAGTTTRFYNSDLPEKVKEFGHFLQPDANQDMPVSVAQLLPNHLHLYDMHGN